MSVSRCAWREPVVGERVVIVEDWPTLQVLWESVVERKTKTRLVLDGYSRHFRRDGGYVHTRRDDIYRHRRVWPARSLVIAEGFAGMCHYHLSESRAGTVALCGDRVMATSIPLDHWRKQFGEHFPKRPTWCAKCEAEVRR